MAELIYASGATAVDLEGLQRGQFKEDALHVEFGGLAKRRLVPLTPIALRAVRTWIEAGSNYAPPERDQLFSQIQTGAAMTAQLIQIELVRLSDLVTDGQFPKFNAPNLRNSFASHLLQNGAAPGLIAYVLGYATMGPVGELIKALADREDAVSPALQRPQVANS